MLTPPITILIIKLRNNILASSLMSIVANDVGRSSSIVQKKPVGQVIKNKNNPTHHQT